MLNIPLEEYFPGYLTQPASQETRSPTSGPSLRLWPEEMNALQLPRRKFFTHNTLHWSPFQFGKSEFAISRFLRTRFSCKSKPQTPMVKGQRFPPVGDFPIGKSTSVMSLYPCATKLRMSNPDLPGFRATRPVTINGSDDFGKSRIAISKSMKLLLSQTLICRYAMAVEFFPTVMG
jgi:hypothetical protein